MTSTAEKEAPDVVVETLSVAFGGETLFDELGHVFRGGRISCLLGPSGCGKSTLLRLIAGLPVDDDRRRRRAVIRIGAEEASPAHVSWMAQRDCLAPWLSVEDNVLLGSRLRREPPDRRACGDILAALGLRGLEKRTPQTLSGGMRQRVALARGLMERRPVMLLDEPFSAVDALTRMKLQDYAIQTLRGRTVILVTHDPHEALRMGDDIFILRGDPAHPTPVAPPPGPIPRRFDDPNMAAAMKTILGLLDFRPPPGSQRPGRNK